MKQVHVRALLCLGAITIPASGATAQRDLSQRDMIVAARAEAPAVRTADELLARTVSISVADVSLRRAIDAVASKANVVIQYRSGALDAQAKTVTLHLDNVSLRQALDRMLVGTPLAVAPDGMQLMIVERRVVVQQQGTIIGKLRHATTKQPISGATILLDDATKGVLTDADGAFRLPATVGEHVVHIRAIGFARETRKVNVAASESLMLDVLLNPTASVLDELIVTGTVVATERKAIPTPITVITAADIEKRGITRVEQLFRGEIPGVIAIDRGAANYTEAALGLMSSARMYSRGSSTLSGGETPLKTFVDGVELLDPSYLNTIDPQSIERVEVITGPQAATIYGSGAMGGVIQIFTKKGGKSATPDLTLALKYGVLQSNIQNGRAPQHNHSLNMTGGTGPEFTYAASGSYNYLGAWQPGLYSRSYGGSVGATHTRGPFIVSGNLSVTAGSNGSYVSGGSQYCAFSEAVNKCYPNLFYSTMTQDGDLPVQYSYQQTQRIATASSQMYGLNVDYRPTSFWQHHLTLGRSQTNFGIEPQRPMFYRYTDTLYNRQASTGQRVTANYNMTLLPRIGPVSSTITVGANGSSGDQLAVRGCTATKSSTTYVPCYSGDAPGVTVSVPSDSWGGFGSWQLGLFDQLFLTLGLRAERNPSYGRSHKTDWTPTNGLTYTMAMGDLTVKLLGSYGSATRAPDPSARLKQLSQITGYDISVYAYQLDAPDLTPEYSRGPQGGIELYYGNLGSLTINHFSQKVTDLIQSVLVDSTQATWLADGSTRWLGSSRYMNVGTMRQIGWEGTGSVNLGPISLKGTYSWNDSRITYRPGGYGLGQTFYYIPTHTGNVVTSYARGGSSLTLVSNWVGSTVQRGGRTPEDLIRSSGRLRVYSDQRLGSGDDVKYPGYLKTDLAFSQRVRPWASATLNVTNLTNDYSSDMGKLWPTLGRQVTFGLSLRNVTR